MLLENTSWESWRVSRSFPEWQREEENSFTQGCEMPRVHVRMQEWGWQVQESAGFQTVLQDSVRGVGGGRKLIFINIGVLNKNFSTNGFFAKLLCSSAVSASPGGGFLAQSSLGPAPGSGLVPSFSVSSPWLPRLFFALALIVVREKQHRWNLELGCW